MVCEHPEFQDVSTLLGQQAPQCENVCPYGLEITWEIYQSSYDKAFKKRRSV